jgi:HD-GYP domain-containing protein (c-di-GMP phosphodiesterase class II)
MSERGVSAARRPRLKLALRLALLFVAAGLVPLVGVILLVLAPRTRDLLRTSARQLHQSEIASLRARIDGRLEDLLADARLLAAGRDDGVERRAQLRFLVDTHPELTALTLYRDGEKVEGAQVWEPARLGAEDLVEHERRARALVGGSVGSVGSVEASDFYPSARRREMLITLVTPLERGRVLAAELSLANVQALVAGTRVGRRGIAYVVDDRGRLVAHPELERVLARENWSPVPIVAGLLPRLDPAQRAVTTASEYGRDGRALVGASAPLGALRWGLVVEEPREDAYGLAGATWAYAAGWTTLALALGMLVALFLARQITTPVARLVEGTRKLAGGAFGTKVPVGGPPEIAELARAFNDASKKLDLYDTDNRRLLLAVERGYVEVLRALVNAIEAKDPYTAGHSQRTAEFAVAIGRAMRLTNEELKEIEVGGLLHDIGKIGIAEQILRKPAQLDDAEMRVMRGHPAIGDAIVSDIEMLARIRSMVRNHHERYDGSGYPDALAGEDIPLGARIIAVADTYDAITSDRCYQPGRPPIDTVPILRRLAGVQLDATVVEALFAALVGLGLLTEADLTATPPPTVLPAEPAGAGAGRRRPTLEITVPPKRSDLN